MATADCVISAGVSVSSAGTKNGAASCTISAGVGVAATRVAWGGSAVRRESMDWLPRADERIVDANGRMTRRFYQFLREISENRLGGVQGPTVPQVATTVTETQETVVGVATFAQQVGQYAQGIAATATATVEVAQDAGLSGSESIPPSPTSPPTYEP